MDDTCRQVEVPGEHRQQQDRDQQQHEYLAQLFHSKPRDLSTLNTGTGIGPQRTTPSSYTTQTAAIQVRGRQDRRMTWLLLCTGPVC